MSKKIKKNALKILHNKIIEKNYKDLSYLNYLNTYLSQKKSENIKNYIRLIKKAIKIFEKSFDDTYLLLFNTKNNYKLFLEYENREFLNFVDEFASILNEKNYIKEADKLLNLKSKIELGYQRYFILNKNQKVYGFSYETNEYSIYDKFDIKIEVSFKEILSYLLELKESKNKKFKKELKIVEKYLEYFPKFIYRKSEKKWLDIEKSLFQKELDLKILNKDIILKDLNNVKIANLILKIL